MFHEEFFPTPKALIEKMLEPYKHEFKRHDRWDEVYYSLSDKVLLEPSAGKGDILNFIEKNSGIKKNSMFCCEVNPDLQAILREDNFSVVADDFLQYEPHLNYNFIVMNPPFSNGDEHLLHAWDILEEGDVICLLNSETVKNPHTKRRKLLNQIIEKHGSVEHLGKEFRDAERKTDVEVCIVRLHKEAVADRFTFFESTEREKSYDLNEESLKDQVARRDVIGNMVLQYETVKGLFAEYIKLHSKLKFYLEPLTPTYSGVDEVISKALKEEVGAKGYNIFVQGLNSMVWKTVINKTNLKNYMTRKVSNDFESWTRDQGMMAFTEKNVAQLIEMIFVNQGTILEGCLVEAFDLMCRYDSENRVHWEGWKTNDAYKVNRKVIMPHFCEMGYRNNMHVRNSSTLDDIDRALGLLVGKKLTKVCSETGNTIKEIETVASCLENHFAKNMINDGPLRNNTVDSEFFTIKYYKKGTLHMMFKDEKLWEWFNLAAAKGKNWLPDEKASSKRKRKSKETGISVI